MTIRSSLPATSSGVHHDPRQPSVAVRKRVDFGNEELQEDGPLERRFEAAGEIESSFEGAPDEVGRHEGGEAGAIRALLELARADAGGVPP